MCERWVTATFSPDETADLDPREKGKPCWVNMALVTRVRLRSDGTHLEIHRAGGLSDLGPFAEPPEHFTGLGT